MHQGGNEKANQLQAAYIRKVVETVNEFDNVLYEVINEGGEQRWDWWVVDTIRNAQSTKRRQHPIGITGHGAERLPSMLASTADWISPGRVDGFAEEPAAWKAEHRKVSILDTDHIWGVGGTADWVWKSFLRGHNPIFMDPYDGSVLGTPGDPRWDPVRAAMGHTRRLAERLNLAAMEPQAGLASTGYWLVNAAKEYVGYLPAGGSVSIDLTAAKTDATVEWIDPLTGKIVMAPPARGGDRRELSAPFSGAAVVYVKVRP